MTNGELSGLIKGMLENAGIPDFEFDGRCIFEDIMDMSALEFAMQRDSEADKTRAEKALALAEKRAKGYPLQYLLGEWEFYGLRFKVGEGVLIPRPDTETLVDEVLVFFKAKGQLDPEIIDLCSGTGCIAAALQVNLPKSRLIAVENSSEAMPYLVENIRANKADVRILKGDVMDGRLLDNFLDEENYGEYRELDCIVSNPPYLTDEEMKSLQKEVTFEPEYALRGGTDGLKFYRVISCLWRHILKTGGLLAFEVGCRQGQAVYDILKVNGYENIRIVKDLGGNDRVVLGTKRGNDEE